MSRGAYYKTSGDFQRARPPIPQSNLLSEPYMKDDSVEYKNSEPTKIKQHSGDNNMMMKWETKSYANSSDPQVWGPAFWFTLHNGAARYPKNAGALCKERMKGFILGMPVMIPCEKCADHATAHIEHNYRRLDDIVSTQENLFDFFVSFHNYVNRRYGKPEMSYEDAFELYTSPTNVTKLVYGKGCPHE